VRHDHYVCVFEVARKILVWPRAEEDDVRDPAQQLLRRASQGIWANEHDSDVRQGVRQLDDERHIDASVVGCPRIDGNRVRRKIDGAWPRPSKVVNVDPVGNERNRPFGAARRRQRLRTHNYLMRVREGEFVESS
jgi:hypothetical protein